MAKIKILFLRTGNSCRSQMALTITNIAKLMDAIDTMRMNLVGTMRGSRTAATRPTGKPTNKNFGQRFDGEHQ